MSLYFNLSAIVAVLLTIFFHSFLDKPFLGAIDFRVIETCKGKAVLVMKNTRKSSSLYGSAHAGAIVTFAETAGALAAFSHFGPKDRGLCTNLNIDPKDRTVKDMYAEVFVTNENAETVAKMTLTFRVDFRSEKTE
ncbi:MAG: hypothetical protein J3R72DRAFT_423559 [Linnemannia gamsii]|nr:MAG: hypothetical protein J3R72DRAFT_423559 [Linnemannia gamsii]